jgi:hypothetical protein
MAKCKNCDYPYATGKNCPNCGSNNPSGASSFGSTIVFIIVIIILAKACGS